MLLASGVMTTDPTTPAANERLIEYMDRHRLSVPKLAKATKISEDAIRSWRANRSIRPQDSTLRDLANGMKLSTADAQDLFPALDTLPHPNGTLRIDHWPSQAAIPAHAWQALLAAPEQRVWILDYAPTALLAAIPDLPQRLADHATHGIDVRVLIADAKGKAIATHDRHIRPAAFNRRHTTLSEQAARARDELKPLESSGLLRVHAAQLPGTAIAVDDQWWSAHAIYAAPPEAWPVTIPTDTDLLHTWDQAFRLAWDDASPY